MQIYRIALLLCLAVLTLSCGSGGDDASDGTNMTADVQTGGLDCAAYVPGTTERDDFLCAHNQVRATASPTPVPPLEDFSWNDNLAAVAQTWADNCSFEHNPNRTTQYNGLSGESTSVGENLFVTSSSSTDAYEAVDAWAAEAADYDYGSNTCATGKVCGHYTQIVWRNSLELGCGISQCGASLVGVPFGSGTLVVCNYAPAGNFLGQSPY